MLRRLTLSLLFALATNAAILPDQLGPNHRASTEAVSFDLNRPIWDEYGLQEAERGDFGSFKITAYGMKDPTGAFAASEWLSGTDPNVAIAGRFVLQCSGKCPKTAQLTDWFRTAVPQGQLGVYPTLDKYLPSKGLVTGSKRYVLGPASIEQFEPRIPQAAAGFDYGPEAQLAKYRSSKGELGLAIFSYPAPQMARQQFPRFQAIPGVTAKRDGPLIALVLPAVNQPADPVAAEKLLSEINYRGQVSWDEKPPMVLKPESAAQMLMSIFSLAGIVLGFCLASGLAFAGYKLLRRKFGDSDAEEGMVWLRISDK